MPAPASSFVWHKRKRNSALASLQRAACIALALVAAATHLSVPARQSSGGHTVRAELARVPIRGGQTPEAAARPTTDPATILRNAKLIYVRKKTAYVEAPEVENELRKRPEFQRWGLAITRDERDADLIIEVGRKVFTRFVYTVIDPRTNIVVLSGKLSSLGGTLSTKIAKRFIEQMRKVRQ
jgi:hypothetical protein